jgi:hypothetical protein
MTEVSFQPTGNDQTFAFQQAIYDVSASGGGNIQIEAGHLCIQKAEMRSCVNVRGRGRNVTNIIPIQDNMNTIEILDQWMITLADFTLGERNLAQYRPNCGIFIGQGQFLNTNLINLEKIFLSHSLSWAPLWLQSAVSVTARDCQFWNYWSAYGIRQTNIAQLPSSFGHALHANAPPSAIGFDNCEVHAMGVEGNGGIAISSTPVGTYQGFNWNGGIISAPRKWEEGLKKSAFTGDPGYTCEIPGWVPVHDYSPE